MHFFICCSLCIPLCLSSFSFIFIFLCCILRFLFIYFLFRLGLLFHETNSHFLWRHLAESLLKPCSKFTLPLAPTSVFFRCFSFSLSLSAYLIVLVPCVTFALYLLPFFSSSYVEIPSFYLISFRFLWPFSSFLYGFVHFLFCHFSFSTVSFRFLW